MVAVQIQSFNLPIKKQFTSINYTRSSISTEFNYFPKTITLRLLKKIHRLHPVLFFAIFFKKHRYQLGSGGKCQITFCNNFNFNNTLKVSVFLNYESVKNETQINCQFLIPIKTLQLTTKIKSHKHFFHNKKKINKELHFFNNCIMRLWRTNNTV